MMDEPGLPGGMRFKGSDTVLFLSLHQPQKESDVSRGYLTTVFPQRS